MIIIIMIKYMFIISDMSWSTRWSRCPGPACRTRKTTEKYARQAGAFQPTHAQCAPRQKCNLAVVEKWCPLLPVFTHCQSHVLLFKDWLYDVRLKFASVKVMLSSLSPKTSLLWFSSFKYFIYAVRLSTDACGTVQSSFIPVLRVRIL